MSLVWFESFCKRSIRGRFRHKIFRLNLVTIEKNVFSCLVKTHTWIERHNARIGPGCGPSYRYIEAQNPFDPLSDKTSLVNKWYISFVLYCKSHHLQLTRLQLHWNLFYCLIYQFIYCSICFKTETVNWMSFDYNILSLAIFFLFLYFRSFELDLSLSSHTYQFSSFIQIWHFRVWAHVSINYEDQRSNRWYNKPLYSVYINIFRQNI